MTKKKSREISRPPIDKELEELIQKYYNTKHFQGRRLLLALIQRKKPGFKPDDERRHDVDMGDAGEET